MPEFYDIFAPKIFYRKIFSRFFWAGEECPPAPVSYAYIRRGETEEVSNYIAAVGVN